MYKKAGHAIGFIYWIIFLVLVLLILVWLYKFKGNVGAYISYLNNQSRENIKTHSLSDVFRWNNQSWQKDTIQDILSTTGENSTSWDINIYDPSFQQDFDTQSIDSILSWEGETENTSGGYGFQPKSWAVITNTPIDTKNQLSGSSKAQLLELIKMRELNQQK